MWFWGLNRRIRDDPPYLGFWVMGREVRDLLSFGWRIGMKFKLMRRFWGLKLKHERSRDQGGGAKADDQGIGGGVSFYRPEGGEGLG